MIDLTNIHSLSEFQRNTKHYVSQMKQSEKPLVLTVNGEAELVVMSAKAFQDLQFQLEYAESVKAIREGIREADEGKTMPVDEAWKQLREKHDLPG